VYVCVCVCVCVRFGVCDCACMCVYVCMCARVVCLHVYKYGIVCTHMALSYAFLSTDGSVSGGFALKRWTRTHAHAQKK
jgi:hypothetical protein